MELGRKGGVNGDLPRELEINACRGSLRIIR